MPKIIALKGFLSFFILHELSEKSMSGDELAKSIGQRKKTILTPGTIYPTLKQLKKQKLIILQRNGRKKMYSLTSNGNKELKLWYIELRHYFKGMKKFL